MAGHEHESQQVVGHLIGLRFVGRKPSLDLVRHFAVLPVEGDAASYAIVVSHAPGLSGTPVSGHCSSAATSASAAASSATPMSWTIRATPAMTLADSIRQTASIARCVSSVPTHRLHHTQEPHRTTASPTPHGRHCHG